jgi:hypothetical protein
MRVKTGSVAFARIGESGGMTVVSCRHNALAAPPGDSRLLLNSTVYRVDGPGWQTRMAKAPDKALPRKAS